MPHIANSTDIAFSQNSHVLFCEEQREEQRGGGGGEGSVRFIQYLYCQKGDYRRLSEANLSEASGRCWVMQTSRDEIYKYLESFSPELHRKCIPFSLSSFSPTLAAW
jgi:hypothetical protein